MRSPLATAEIRRDYATVVAEHGEVEGHSLISQKIRDSSRVERVMIDNARAVITELNVRGNYSESALWRLT